MKTVRILSIDGGGIRGILPARMLQHIEETTGKPVAQLFDLISGTSTGGILACGLLAGLSAKSLGDLYAQRGGEIFANARTVGSVISGPKYSAKSLETILQQTLGETWLSETKGLEMLVPSYCIQAPAPVPIDGGGIMSSQLPMTFTTWEARATLLRAGQDPRAVDWKLRDIARATSAAPTYFPPAHITNRASDGYWFVDGGVFANPSIAALSAAKRLWPDADRIVLLSLGTGTDETPMNGAHAAHWGDVMWLSPILSILLGAGPDFAVCEAYDQLGDDHVRLDTGLGKDVASAFDDASAKNIAALEALSQQLISKSADQLSKLLGDLNV